MHKPNKTALPLTASPVYLVAHAINTLVRSLPAGTAYFLGVVLVTLGTGQLVHRQGSRARAVLPYVGHWRWGWHRVERAIERGAFGLDALCEQATAWGLANLPAEPVRLGRAQHTVHALDSTTIVRLRSRKASARLGKGYDQGANRIARHLPALCGPLTKDEARRVLAVGVAQPQDVIGSLSSLIEQRR